MPIAELLAEILAENTAMTVGLARNGVPTLEVVVFGCDERMNFLWISRSDGHLSDAVAENPSATFAILDCASAMSQIIGLKGSGFVVELADVELSRSTVDFFSWRYPDGEIQTSRMRLPSDFSADAPHRLYRLTPSAMFAVRSGTNGDDVSLEQVDSGRVAAALRAKVRQRFLLEPECSS